MRAHTNAFKQEIASFGKQISGRLYQYNNTDPIDEELIYSISLVKNGQLLQSLMKELDFEAQYDLDIGEIVNAQFGVLVGNNFEYLDYGNYIVYSKEYIAENQTWQYVCYDKMLYSMVQYEPLNLTYPCTIREYLIALANRIGLNFANANDTFTNYNQQVLNELFDNQTLTYRDILDKLSEITASNILINDNDELELGYPSETNDTIDEENLKDVNVNFGEIFGPINKVGITETDGGYAYTAEDSQSIEENGLWQVNINDNLFAFNGDSNTIAQNILNKLNGLYYSINDFSTTGVCYYDYLDLFNVSIGEDIYKCLLLNNEINITQGLEENIFTERRENTKTEQNNYETSITNNKQVQFQINKQKGEIEARVEKSGVINAINLSEEGIQILANKLGLTATDVINIIAGNEINIASKNISLKGNNLLIDKNNIELNDLGDNTINPTLKISSDDFVANFISKGMYINWDTGVPALGSGKTMELTPQWLRFFKYFANNNTGYTNIGYAGLTTLNSLTNKETDISPEKIITPKITAGNIDSGTCILNSSRDEPVSFGKTFENIPNVVITPNTSASGVIASKIRSISTTGFVATIGGSVSGDIDCCWIAISN